jgi:uncharacterized protein
MVMVKIIEQNLSKIQEACKEHNVVLLQLFGSAARGDDFTEESDVDFLVSFQPFQTSPTDEGIFWKVENFRQLHKKLEVITKRKVDLVEEKSISNKYLRYFINQDKKLLYAKT